LTRHTFSTICVSGIIFDLEMVVASFRFEDRLDGASNFVPWKARVTLVLMENGLWEFANTKATPPMDPKDLD
jgi:hypothetical protein